MSQSELPLLPKNPFRPGAGQQPIYLAGRDAEQKAFARLLEQDPISQNAIVTGLRGIGKTVLLETLKPIAQSRGWLWAANDLSETASLTEENLIRRVIVDLSALLAPIFVQQQQVLPLGFGSKEEIRRKPIEFDDLWKLYMETAGLPVDKLKEVLNHVGKLIAVTSLKGIVFAYDEAQNLADHSQANQYPLSILLDAFSAIQRHPQKCKFLLLLAGLPTLYPKLNEARTYTERMFNVMQLDRLNETAAREAIVKPIELTQSQLTFSDATVQNIVRDSGGYPYFIQFMCKEVFEAWIGKIQIGEAPSVPMGAIIAKLDQDFFAPRWQRASDRQQDFMKVIATLPNASDEFSVQDIVAASKQLLRKGFSASHTHQMLVALTDKGLIYRNRRGAYFFAVPGLGAFVARQQWDPQSLKHPPSANAH